jgi:hypothetical protein
MPRALEIAVRRAILERCLSVIVIPSDVVLKPAARCILSRSRAVNELASDEAIFTCDVGLQTVWAVRYLAMNGRRHRLVRARLDGQRDKASHRRPSGLFATAGDLIIWR